MYILDEYSPKTLQDCLHKTTISKLTLWLKDYKKPLLLTGSVGTGKSTLVRLFANENNFTLYELTPSDDKDKETLENTLQAVCKSRSIFSNKNLVFFDDIDVFISDDKQAFETILKASKESTNPVIFCATNIYSDKKLSALRDLCEIVDIPSVHTAILANYFSNILIKKQIKFEKEALDELIKMNGQDIRSTLLDIDYLSAIGITKTNLLQLSGRERKSDVFKTIIGLFRSKTFSEAQKISDNTDIDYDMLFLWVSENLHLFYENENLKEAYKFMSLADLNKSRIYSRQNWVFFKYFISLGIIAPTLVPKKDKFTFKISFPQSIKLRTKEMSDYSKNRKASSILSKIFRGSNKKINSELFLYKMFVKDFNFIELLKSNLTDDELEFMQDFFKIKLVEKPIKASKDFESEDSKSLQVVESSPRGAISTQKEKKSGTKEKKTEIKIEHKGLNLISKKENNKEETSEERKSTKKEDHKEEKNETKIEVKQRKLF